MGDDGQGDALQPLLQTETTAPAVGGGINISFVAGTILDGDEQSRMQRMLFRITRGKALTHFSAPFTQD